jgi:hypothetical protein
MLEICRKKPLARNLAAMAEILPEYYGTFSPRAFQLPEQYAALAAELSFNRGNKQVLIALHYLI